MKKYIFILTCFCFFLFANNATAQGAKGVHVTMKQYVKANPADSAAKQLLNQTQQLINQRTRVIYKEAGLSTNVKLNKTSRKQIAAARKSLNASNNAELATLKTKIADLKNQETAFLKAKGVKIGTANSAKNLQMKKN